MGIPTTYALKGITVTTFDELVRAGEVDEAQAEKRSERALSDVKYIHEKVRRDGRTKLTEDEDREVAAAMAIHKEAREARKGV